jgi:hypothetical protein
MSEDKKPDFEIKLEFEPTPEQKDALKILEEFLKDPKQKEISLGGLSGSGKTTLLREFSYKLPALSSLSRKDGAGGIRVPSAVAWAGMTGKAAQRLTQVTGKYARTLHGTLYQKPNVDHNDLSFDELQEPTCQILIVDEASMITPSIYEDLQVWQKKGVKVIFVGDFFQLPPILDKKEEAMYGGDFSIFSQVKGPMLTKVMRSKNEIVEIGSELREKKVVPRTSRGAYQFVVAKDPTQEAIDRYFADNQDHVLITWRNEIRMDANKRIRERFAMKTSIAKNEPIIIRRNGQGLLNGDVKKLLNVEPGPTIGGAVQTLYMTFEDVAKPVLVTVRGKAAMDGQAPYLADRKQWINYMSQLKKDKLPEPLPVTYGYTFTAHLAQGSEYKQATTFLRREEMCNPAFLRPTKLPTGESVSFGVRWVYTAITRAKEKTTFILDS